MKPGRSSILVFVMAGALVHAIGLANAFGQALIFADDFESGNATAWSFAGEVCDNGTDDDGDGFVDGDDFDCVGTPPCP